MFADGDMQDVIPVVIVEPSSSSVASNSSTASSNSDVPESSTSQGGTDTYSGSEDSVDSGSSQGGNDATPGSNAGTAAVRHTNVPSVVLQGEKWFDTKGRRLEKKPTTSGSYVNNGQMQTIK